MKKNYAGKNRFSAVFRKRQLFRSCLQRSWKNAILVILLAGFVSGCHSYFKVNSSQAPSAASISALDNAAKTIIVHFENKKWILNDLNINDSILTGKQKTYDLPPTVKPVKPDKPNRYLTRTSNNQRYLLNEVHLYVDEYTTTIDGKVSIPMRSVRKMEIYDKDTQTTVGSYILSGLGIASAAYLVVGIIVLLTKESCPFIYTLNGDEFRFAGEIYSGSIHKPLERDDYLKLPFYPGKSNYTLKITNEVHEIQHTNLTELLIIDHPAGSGIIADKYGKIHPVGKPVLPVKAVNSEGKDVSDLLETGDGKFYQSCPRTGEIPLKDGVILTFLKEPGATSAKVLVRAKNSVIFDYMMGQFHDFFGTAYQRYMNKQESADPAALRQMALERGFPLSLYIEKEGRWIFHDYFNIAGPMAFRDDVLEIPLEGDETDSLRIKLEFGTFLWEVDYAAVDFSQPVEYQVISVPVITAFDENSTDVSALLKDDDNRYYSQPETGNQAIVTFNLPGTSAGDRTVILHSKGWYQVLRDPEGFPETKQLEAFRDPAYFNRFINNRMMDMGRKMSQSTRPE